MKSAGNPFTPGDYVIKPDYDDPDLAVVVDVSEEDRNISIAFLNHFEEEAEKQVYVPPAEFSSHCEEFGIKSYSYEHAELSFEHQY